jgi:hypothetical protein
MVGHSLRMSNTTYTATIRNAETTVILSEIGVSVYVKNASARAWSRCGYGKHFATMSEAIANYKSSAMKSFLQSIKAEQEPANVIQFA